MHFIRVIRRISFQLIESTIPFVFYDVMDDIMDCFIALNIQATNNTGIIKQAYCKLLQKSLADPNADNFLKLRRHYLEALRSARSIFDVVPSPNLSPFENTEHQRRLTDQSNHRHATESNSLYALRQALRMQPNSPFILTDIAKYYLIPNK